MPGTLVRSRLEVLSIVEQLKYKNERTNAVCKREHLSERDNASHIKGNQTVIQ